MNRIDEKRIPKAFLRDYRMNIALRCLGSAVLMLLSGFLCTKLDFSGTKYPAMGVALVLAAGAALACLIFRLHWILFRRSWMGTVLEVGAANAYQVGHMAKPELASTVKVVLDRGDSKPYSVEIVEKDAKGKNPYQLEAPYKVGDTVVYFRGMKRFARLDVEKPEELFDPKFVCAFCGLINGGDRERCFRCGKTLLK